MTTTLAEICNLQLNNASSKTMKYRPIYAFLTSIESEYAISVLKKNKEDTIYKHIASYYLTQDLSAKTLFNECFAFEEEMQELHSRLKFDESDINGFNDFAKSIKWESTTTENKFQIGDFSFTTNKMFLEQKIVDGKCYALEIKIKEDGDYFEVIGAKECHSTLSYKAQSNLKKMFTIEEIDFAKYKYTDTPQLSKEQFFTITNKLKETDDEQKLAISADTNKNVLMIAGAGSGKTRSLVGRLTYLHIVKGVPLSKLMLLTFTRAATQEMAVSAHSQIKEAYLTCGMTAVRNPHILANTIDGFFKQTIERYYVDVGLTQKPIFLLDNSFARERIRLLGEVISENHLNNIFQDYLKTEKDLKRLYDALDNCANGMTVNISGLENLLDLFVEKQIKENKIVDFVYNAYILKKALSNSDCPLFSRITNLYECILIDEFQDINKLQNDVLSKFYNSNIHFTFVGDDDQTIYTWRGADNGIIKNMVNDPHVETVYLTTNYRNNPYIVNAGNDILSTLEDRAKVGRPIKAAKTTGSKVRITVYDEKYKNLAHEIKKAYDVRLKGEKICVLCRQINDQRKNVDGQWVTVEGEGTKIARMLSLENVPTVFCSDEGVSFSDGYKLLKALVLILNKIDVRNNCAYVKELLGSNSSNTNIRKLVFGKIPFKNIDSNAAMVYTAEIVSKLAESLNLKYTFAQNFVELVSNYNRIFAELIEGQHNADRKVKDTTLQLFQELSSEYNWEYPRKKDKITSIFSLFEEEVSKKTTKKVENEQDDGSVIISSIHKAKGLQYDTVFIVGLNDGEYPNNSQIIAEYNRRVGEFQRLKVSQANLEKIRTSVNNDTIKGLLEDCNISNGEVENDPELKEDLSSFADEIDGYSDDYLALSEDGVDSFIDAYETYIDRHIQARRDLIIKKTREIAVVQEEADEKEEMYHEAEDESPEAQTFFDEWQLLSKEIVIMQQSLDMLKNALDGFLKKFSNILSFYEICNEAKGFLTDVRKLRDESAMIKKLEKEKKDKELEEKRLFYVAVSRASDKLYLCVREGSFPSQFIKLINESNCEKYIMQTKAQEEEIKRLEESIHSVRDEVNQPKINEKKIEKGIEKILNYSEEFKNEMNQYLSEYLQEHPEYNKLPKIPRQYFDNAIGLMALSEKLGYNFKTEIVHNLERLVQLLLQDKIGDKAKPYKTDSASAHKITLDIRNIAKNRCKVGIPGEGYLMDLFTKESKFNDELERCKSLAIQCYVVCGGKYRIADYIQGTWSFKKLNGQAPEEFLVAALDLTNIRNAMIHDDNELWKTDYLPYAFICLDTIMHYLGLCAEPSSVEKHESLNVDEMYAVSKLKEFINSNKNRITSIRVLFSLMKDVMDNKTAKVLCILDEKVLKDIISGVINSKRGTDIAYLRNKTGLTNEACLIVISIWEDAIEGQIRDFLKTII